VITFTHIVCPIDFSDTSARALAYAVAFAAWYDASLTVLHVATTFDKPSVPVADGTTSPYPGSRDDLLARVERAIDRAGGTALRVRPLVQEGVATELIVQCGRALKTDLLVMGTHGLTGFHRLLLGSVTEKVVRTAVCPVLTVPPGAPAAAIGTLSLKQILCPVDFSRSAVTALQYAVALARQVNGRLTALYALEVPEPDDFFTDVDPDRIGREQLMRDHASRRLATLLTEESDAWCDTRVVAGRAYKVILEEAATLKADLIVMGAQGSSGIELMLYGSNTQHVVRAATCPVLTVRV
jgi:nucleotide-binding universal stress UspA family protein